MLNVSNITRNNSNSPQSLAFPFFPTLAFLGIVLLVILGLNILQLTTDYHFPRRFNTGELQKAWHKLGAVAALMAAINNFLIAYDYRPDYRSHLMVPVANIFADLSIDCFLVQAHIFVYFTVHNVASDTKMLPPLFTRTITDVWKLLVLLLFIFDIVLTILSWMKDTEVYRGVFNFYLAANLLTLATVQVYYYRTIIKILNTGSRSGNDQILRRRNAFKYASLSGMSLCLVGGITEIYWGVYNIHSARTYFISSPDTSEGMFIKIMINQSIVILASAVTTSIAWRWDNLAGVCKNSCFLDDVRNFSIISFRKTKESKGSTLQRNYQVLPSRGNV